MPVNSVSSSSYNNVLTYYSNGNNDKQTGTSIKKENGYYGAAEKAKETVQKYYEKMYKENMSFADPLRHIEDKYSNRMSPFFRSDMTREERSIAYNNEKYAIQMNGQCFYGTAYYMDDYVFRDSKPIINVEVEDYKRTQYNRTAITAEINQLFKDNNISIPNDVSFKFSINPYDFTIAVLGLEDKELTGRIEKLLNVGDNGKYFYDHLYQAVSRSEDSNQMTQEKLDKRHLYWVVKQETGYDLRTLRNENGRFYTEDGKDILDLFRRNPHIPAAYRNDVVDYYTPFLIKYGKLGFNNGDDMYLSIEYRNGELYDIGQSKGYGPGQNDWISSL